MAPAIEAVLRPLLVETVVDGNTMGPGRGDEVFQMLDGVVFLEVFEGGCGYTVGVKTLQGSIRTMAVRDGTDMVALASAGR